MTSGAIPPHEHLVGIGLYTPKEAGALLGIATGKISRWLRGHSVGDHRYDPLWQPQVDLGADGFCLGFRDLQEVRVAAAFMAAGLSAIRVRRAIELARDLIGEERPLSTVRFRTDGRSVFLQLVEEDGETRLLDLFGKQFAFGEVLERSLTNVDHDQDGNPALWWPLGRAKQIVLDPRRSFGQPIDAETSVPVSALARSFEAEGSEEAVARVWGVPLRSVRRALQFSQTLSLAA